MKVSFHSIAQHAKFEAGHFFHYHLACQEAAASFVSKSFVYVPKDTEISPLPSYWKKWFSPIFNSRHRKEFIKDCFRLFQQPCESDEKRIFFLEYFTKKDFKRFAVAALFFARKNDTLWILFRDDITIRRKKEKFSIYIYSKLLQWRFKKRFLPLSDSQLLGHYYFKWFQQELKIVPIPHVEFRPMPEFRKKETLICISPGEPRSEKGIKEICRLMKIDDPRAQDVTFNLSGATFFSEIKNGLKIELRRALLSQADYFKNLHHADIVLLPYDKYKYQKRTSGPFVEAVIAGKLPFVKEGSWLAYELHRFNLSECIVDWEHPRFFSHLFTIVNDAKVYEKLQKMQQSYAQFHSSSTFKKIFQELFQKC